MIDLAEDRTTDTGQCGESAIVLSAREAASRLGLNERTIRRAISQGNLRAVKQSGTFSIACDDLERFREQRATVSAPGPDVRHWSLPAQADPILPIHTQLFGREQEHATILRLLAEERVRLLTLTGPGGVGKTRLGLAVAVAMGDMFTDGAWWVDLSPLNEAIHVPDAIARGLGMRNATAGLDTLLKQRNLLLVLDNFERLLPAAPGIADMLAACPGVQVLVTSRIPLHLYNERLFPVQPLPTLAANQDTPSPALVALAAVQLFAARAQAVMPGFTLSGENATAVADICHRLDGLPLAIELAAARSAVLSPRALLARLSPRLPLLTGGPDDQPHRLRTMRDTIAWSYDLLDDARQRLFRQLSVFASGFTLQAAVAVCGTSAGSSIRMLDDLSALVSHSLLRQVAPGDGEPRFAFLETVREYGGEQLSLHGEAMAARHCHATWALALAETLSSLLDGHDDRLTLDQFEAERENCRAALAWLLETDDVELALRLGAALLELWYHRGPVTEGRNALRRALARSGTRPNSPMVRIRALQAASLLAFMQRDAGEADRLALESLVLARSHGTTTTEAWALNLRGLAAFAAGQAREAAAFFDLALALLPADEDGNMRAMMQMNRATVTADPARARNFLLDALALCRESGDRGGGFVLILNRLGDLETTQGQYAAAFAFYIESFDCCRELRDFWSLPQSLDGMAKVRTAMGQPGEAAFLVGVADAVRKHMEVPIAPGRPPGDPGAAGSQPTGTAAARMDELEGLIATARSLPVELPPDVTSHPAHHGLTPRERDVLALLVEGHSNRAIASALSVSERTIDSHVFHILTKLRLESRSAAAVWAIRNHLA